MKIFLSLAAAAFLAGGSLLQTGCTSGVYAVGPAPAPAYYGGYPVSSWGGAGFYGGAAYYRPGWNNNYYRSSSGNVNTWRGGSASWNNGSGNASGWRGGSASWGGGSGSASGWRGGSASWGGGSGSWHGPRGGGGSWHR